MRTWLRCFTALLLALSAAGARAGTTEPVSGSLTVTPVGEQRSIFSLNYTCYGYPTCTGIYSGVAQDTSCSNSFAMNNIGMSIAGLDLSKPGTVQVQLTLQQDWTSNVTQGSSTCTYALKPGAPNLGFSVVWDGARGTTDSTWSDGSGTYRIVGTLTAVVSPAAPVFPMTVSSSITATQAAASATIQPRPQDVGATSSIFVFAHAPSSIVQGASQAKRAPSTPPAAAKTDDAVVCVLAQVGASGQLVAVSASTMQAYLTGVLTSQSQAVQILNNVPTSSVAGATLFVGYGGSAANMLSSGVYQTAISVPGPVQCTASLASAPAPESPGALTGLWWGGAGESGWGVHFTQRGSNVFAAWYTYDGAGNPKWYVATCAGVATTSGTCTGTLYQVNGPTFFGVPFTPITPGQVSGVGTLKVAFADANDATLTFTVGAVSRTVPIVREPVAVGAAVPAVDYSDLWWNPNESGWGMAMAQQNANIFLAWYVYDGSGKPIWYVAPNCAVNGSGCSGTLYATTGPAFGPTFDPNQVHAASVGSAIVSFIDANNAVLSYTVNGVQGTKTITRQLF